MDVHLRKLTGKQDDLVATWQLTAAGWNPRTVHHWSTKEAWRQIHDGVWALGQAPLTRRQLLIAAVLTAPNTFINALSACDCHGFHEYEGSPEMVVRPGDGGPREYRGLLVARSSTLEGATTRIEGIPVVKPERALISGAPMLSRGRLGRAFRESIRTKVTTADDIAKALDGQRGTAVLRRLCDRYADIPYHRCRSDAESRGLEVLHDAGIPLPSVNVRVAGREGDFVYREWKLIIEIHSKEFHAFPIDDLEKKARWEAAGMTVRYVWANDVYFRPHLLLAAAVPPNVPILDP